MTVVAPPQQEAVALIDSHDVRKKNVPFDEALHVVGEGRFTYYLTFVCGLSTLAALSSMQSMYFILPSVGCEMDLSPVKKAMLGSVTFLGSVTSSNIFGFLVDQYGRRKILLISTIGTCIFSLTGSLSPNADSLMISTFLTGVTLGGIFGLPYVYLSEFCNHEFRAKYISISSIIVMLGNVYSPCVGWLVSWLNINLQITENFIFSSWRLYILLNAIPMLVSVFMFEFLPESPKYLLFTGKNDEAIKVLASCYESNTKTSKEEFPVHSLCLDPEDEGQQGSSTQKNDLMSFFSKIGGQLKEIFIPPLLLYTCICSFLMVGVIGLYGAVQLWIPENSSRMLDHLNEKGYHEISLCEVMSNHTSQNTTDTVEKCQVPNEIFVISIVIGIASFLYSILVVFLVHKIQAKIILGSSLLLSSIFCALVVVGNSIYLMILSLGAIAAIVSGAHSLVFTFLVNFFPTSSRATATMVALFFGRIMVPIGGSLLGAAFKSYCQSAYSIIAVTLAILAIVSYTIPAKKKETRNS